jgi:hypothetical protein
VANAPPTPGRLLVSAFIVLYLLANLVVAIPGPQDMVRLTGERFSPDDRVARFVRPHLDGIVPPAQRLATAVWTAAAPLRARLGPLVRRVRLAQRWRMFAQPPRTNTLLAVRVDGRLPTGEDITRAVQVLPSGEDTRFRGLSFYRSRYRDKALTNSIEAWERMRRDHPGRDEQGETDYGRDVYGRIARYFGPRVSAAFPPGTVVTRSEVWQGARPIAPRGFPEETVALPPLSSLPAGAALGQKVSAGRASWVLRRVLIEERQ